MLSVCGSATIPYNMRTGCVGTAVRRIHGLIVKWSGPGLIYIYRLNGPSGLDLDLNSGPINEWAGLVKLIPGS